MQNDPSYRPCMCIIWSWGHEMKRYPVMTIREYLSYGLRTWEPALRVMAWSFNASWLIPKSKSFKCNFILNLKPKQLKFEELYMCQFDHPCRYSSLEWTQCLALMARPLQGRWRRGPGSQSKDDIPGIRNHKPYILAARKMEHAYGFIGRITARIPKP